MPFKIESAGVNSLILRLANHFSAQLPPYLHQLRLALKQRLGDGLIELVPSYTTLFISYDLLRLDEQQIRAAITDVIGQLQHTQDEHRQNQQAQVQKPILQLPVCYDGEYAPDLARLAAELGLTCAEVIERHSTRVYQVYAVGFSPGFGYLGELDPLLRVPRLDTPRTRVPAGSVAIAEHQTAIYPQETPGGWWLIGRCPVAVFDKYREQPCLFEVGDRVQFQPVSSLDYQRYLNQPPAGGL